MQSGSEETSPRKADHASREEWKPKGFPSIVASAHEKWHEQREYWRAGCCTQHACGEAKEHGVPPRGQLEDGNQSVGQGPTYWGTRKRQRCLKTLPGGGRRFGEPRARQLVPKGKCGRSAVRSAVPEDSGDRTTGEPQSHGCEHPMAGH